MLQGTTVPPGFSGCSSFPGLLLKANLSWIYAGLNPPFLLRVGMPMQCMHSAILLWKIRPSVRPSVDHTLVLYRNECAIVKLFPASGRDVTPVFSSINAVTKFQSFHGGGKKLRFLTEIAVYLGNGTRQVHCYCATLYIHTSMDRLPSVPLTWSDLERRHTWGHNCLANFLNYAQTV